MPHLQFQTRARAVDMLGRQQIAGISTAVSELFKNAYDAYATRVEADLLRSKDLLVLRDDGIGMTLDDFANRWLTIATDSKVENRLLPKPRVPPDLPHRPTLGEKGIGRLAIATLGPTTLVLTRARIAEKQDEIVCALLDWEMFELPGINLNEIDIPIVTRKPSSLPSAANVRELANAYGPMLRKFHGRTDAEKLAAITHRLNTLEIDPSAIQAGLDGLSLLGDGASGTHFFIRPVDDRVTAQLDLASSDPANPSNLVRLLIGFSNTMTPDHPPEPIKTAFRDHRDDLVVDVISEDQFFTPEEFKNADHQIVGSFDDWGTFNGIVSVYGGVEEYSLPFAIDGQRRKLECGPFKFSLAVVQMKAGETTIPTAEYEALKKKLDRYGGLYIYNDDIRVLPYGDSRTDFIDVERRRTQNVGRAFFSYRRMFGVIELDREKNSALKEKAGREGFRENKAFAEFRAVLIDFFTQTAANFFAPEGDMAARFIERRDKLKHLAAEEKRRSAEGKRARAEFGQRLASLSSALDGGQFRIEAGAVAERLTEEVALARSSTDPVARRSVLHAAAQKAHAEASTLRLKYQIDLPPGLALTPDLRRDLEAYQNDLQNQIQLFVEPIFFEVERDISSSDRASRQRYLEETVERSFQGARDSLRSAQDGVLIAASDIVPRTKALAQELEDILEETRDKCLTEAKDTSLEKLSERDLFELATRLEREITIVAEDGRQTLSAYRAQIERFRWYRDGDGIVTDIEVSTAVEDRLLALEEQASHDLELAQLGLFSQIISHEFVASMTAVRHLIARLADYAKDQPNLKRLYEDIHASFGTLDGYLGLFAPLQRRLYGPRTTVQGRRIFPNTKRVFEDRLAKAEATLDATPEFREFASPMYPSTLFPVLVNLIDNALYWLERSPKPRRIVLSAQGRAILVSNNGPSISERDKAVIFEPGFSRKPGGRGLGLWISQQVLSRDGYRLALVAPQPEMNVTFAIVPVQAENSDEGSSEPKE
jgi:signal transduction histidine kinase